MPVLRSREIGDLHIQVRVETPQNLTKRQRELLAEFEQESSNKTHPESSGFFAKMKDFSTISAVRDALCVAWRETQGRGFRACVTVS